MAGLFSWWPNGGVTISIGSASIHAAVADTESERAIGLSQQTSIAANRGMLFVFPRDAKWQIWMKDMKLPIDIVWLDAHKKVVSVQANALPSSYPGHFTPPADARYVLELASGTAQKAGIHPGTRADLTVHAATK